VSCITESAASTDSFTTQTRPLQLPVDALGGIDPDGAVSSHERFDLSASQLDSSFAQLVQRSERIAQESEAILFIGDQPSNN